MTSGKLPQRGGGLTRGLFVLQIILAALLSLLADAQILQTWPGPITVTGGGTGTRLVNTANDTGNWLTGNGNYTTGTASVPLYFQVTLLLNNIGSGSGGSDFFTAFQLAMGFPNNVTNERFAVGNNSASSSWSGFQSGSNEFGDFTINGNPGTGGSNALSLAETVTFLLKLDQSANSAVIWFNPNVSLTESNQNPGLTTFVNGLGIEDTFDSLWIRAGPTTGSTTFSNMSVRNNSPFALVPEPSHVFLIGLAVSTFFLRRSRKIIPGNQSLS